MAKSLKRTEQVLGYAFVVPIIFLVFVVIGFPFLYTVILSFTDKRIGYDPQFIGLRNYVNLFNDLLYWSVLKNTFVYTFFCILLKLVFGMLFALLLNERFRGRGLVRVSMLLPWAIPGMVAAHAWKWIYNDQYGILNAVLHRLGLISSPIPWLSDMNLALVAVIIVNVWRGIPFFVFSILGALQTIDQQLYDAAQVDGAHILQRFFHVTLPSIIPVVAITTLLSTIWTFNDFDNIWLITGGGPLNASSVIATYTYEISFISNEMAQALAVAVSVIPFMVLLLSVALKHISGRGEQ